MLNEGENLYLRQMSLGLYVPTAITVVGVGGVGSWVALNFALIGVRDIYLVDPDVVEQHNLNRTPFKLTHIGMYKVDALKNLITERREDIDVEAYPVRFEDLPGDAKSYISMSHVIDCRDSLSPISPEPVAKLGYDGMNITLHLNPDYSSIFGDGDIRYSVTPSFLVPPQLLANLVTLYMVSPHFRSHFDIRKEEVIRLDVNQLLRFLMEVQKEGKEGENE